MAIRNGQPVRFTPKGICDAFDATDAFPGSCALLTNLIFDQANPEVMVSRPGVGPPRTAFASFTAPTFVSGFITIGSVVYGMVSTGRNAGHDEPFAFDLNAGAREGQDRARDALKTADHEVDYEFAASLDRAACNVASFHCTRPSGAIQWSIPPMLA